MAFLGHAWPVWFAFRGGKGVATFLGTMLALAPLVGVALCVTWLAGAFGSRISSVGAVAAAASTPLWAVWLRPDAVAVSTIFAVLVVLFHRPNLVRLRTGTEPRIGRS